MNSQALPAHWKVEHIAELDLGGVTNVKPLDFPNEIFEYYSIPAYRDSKTPRMTKGSEILSQKLLIPPRCVLFGKLNPRVQKVWNVKQASHFRCIASTEWLPVVPKEDIDPDFAYFLLYSNWVMPVAQGLVSGSTPSRQRVEPKAFYEILVPVPDFNEQQKIASVLGLFERAVQFQSGQIECLQMLKRATMRSLFTRGLRSEAQKETEIGPVPESWVLTPCDQIFKLTSGKKRPSNLSDYPTDEKSFPVLGGNGVMGFSGKWYLDIPQALIIGRVGEYCGAVHIASGKLWVTDNALYAKEWLEDEADLAFVGAFLEYFDLNRFKRMAGQPLVTQGMINEHSVPLPEIAEQREIVTILDAIDRKIDLHRRKCAVLDDLFKALLHKLMTGEIRVTDLSLCFLNLVAVELP